MVSYYYTNKLAPSRKTFPLRYTHIYIKIDEWFFKRNGETGWHWISFGFFPPLYFASRANTTYIVPQKNARRVHTIHKYKEEKVFLCAESSSTKTKRRHTLRNIIMKDAATLNFAFWSNDLNSVNSGLESVWNIKPNLVFIGVLTTGKVIVYIFRKTLFFSRRF